MWHYDPNADTTYESKSLLCPIVDEKFPSTMAVLHLEASAAYATIMAEVTGHSLVTQQRREAEKGCEFAKAHP